MYDALLVEQMSARGVKERLETENKSQQEELTRLRITQEELDKKADAEHRADAVAGGGVAAEGAADEAEEEQPDDGGNRCEAGGQSLGNAAE